MSSAEPAPEPTATAAEAGGERKGLRTRRRILDAARGVFAEVGYERATIRGIAAAAGVDKSSVIQYFGTKQALFREAVHWDIPIAELTSDDRPRHGEPSPWDARRVGGRPEQPDGGVAAHQHDQ